MANRREPGSLARPCRNMLPKRTKVAKVVHHPALPWPEMGVFMAALKDQAGTSALALQFTILTAARTGEVIGARWPEMISRVRRGPCPAIA